MKGDFSRNTFDPRKHYTRVLMQQGRVQLDADWNEQQAITETRVETEAADVIGACGAPMMAPGFEITVEDGKSLQIGAGRFYVDGILCQNEAAVSYGDQPHYPQPPDALELLQKAGTTLGLVYLDVWQRHLTALNDPLIREVALGGPDTATRLQTIWQVKVMPLKTDPADERRLKRLLTQRANAQKQLDQLIEAGSDKAAIEAARAKLTEIEAAIAQLQRVPFCADPADEWEQLIAPSTGKLNARTQAPEDAESVCELPPTAGYQRLENQLYRVEVHRPGALGTATFKWSRDNGSVITTIEKFSGQELTVHDVGPDDVLGFANDQWVEIVDEVTELHGGRGQLAQIADVDPATRIITLKTAPSPVNPARRPKLRRWDQAGTTATNEGVETNGGWLPLEGGIEVQFSAREYATGDYWLIPARTATGEIEWPPFETPNTTPIAQPPLGIHHHYCRLALVALTDDGLARRQDCRIIFPPLASPALHVTGTNWTNDDVFTLADLAKDGLAIALDGTPDPETVDNSTVIVTAEMPFGQTGLNLLVVVAGTVTVEANVIRWRLQSGGGQATQPDSGSTAPQPIPPLQPNFPPFVVVAPRELAMRSAAIPGTFRIRLTLKGHVIWGDFGPRRLYLDGQAFGQPGLRADNKTRRTALIFPTGHAQRASDFESWFFLGAGQAAAPLRVTSVNFIRSVGGAEQPSSAGIINVPPIPTQPVIFKAGENVSIVEITFNRPVSDSGLGGIGQPQAIRIERQIATGSFVRIAGTLAKKAPAVVRFNAQDPQIITEGPWVLVAQGDSSQLGPAVTAADDGSALDGDYSGQAGGDFRLALEAQ